MCQHAECIQHLILLGQMQFSRTKPHLLAEGRRWGAASENGGSVSPGSVLQRSRMRDEIRQRGATNDQELETTKLGGISGREDSAKGAE